VTHSRLVAARRLALFLFVIGSLAPPYLLTFPLGKRVRRFFALPFYRTCLNLTGLSLHAKGIPANGTGVLFVANHASYLDVPVLAALIDGLFVAKSEVRGWPVFGFLARIAGTLFVARKASKIPQQRLMIAENLTEGNSIFLFPEGSSSDGSTALPFRRGLLSSALVVERPVYVQPVSIVYGPALGNRPALSQSERDRYAWYGDMELVPHLWHLFGLRRVTPVTVRFHPPQLSSEFENPSDLASWAERAVVEGIQQDLRATLEPGDVLEAYADASSLYASS